MMRSSFVTERRKTNVTNNLKTSQNRATQNQNGIRASQYQSRQNQNKDDISKYNSLNREINKLIRTINLTFNFKTFKKEKLQPLEPVRIFL